MIRRLAKIINLTPPSAPLSKWRGIKGFAIINGTFRVMVDYCFYDGGKWREDTEYLTKEQFRKTYGTKPKTY